LRKRDPGESKKSEGATGKGSERERLAEENQKGKIATGRGRDERGLKSPTTFRTRNSRVTLVGGGII